MDSSVLFTPLSLGSLTMPNRLVRSATWEGLAAADGTATPALNQAMAELARGGVGLIISSHAYVSPEGKVVRGQLSADNDGRLPGLREMTQTVHAAGGRIALQLAHGGGFAAGEKATGLPALGPSSFAANQGSTAQEMPLAEIARVTADFAKAACRAKDAGFDAVQIHAAHGYLLSEFLSPHYNQRLSSTIRASHAATGWYFPRSARIWIRRCSARGSLTWGSVERSADVLKPPSASLPRSAGGSRGGVALLQRFPIHLPELHQVGRHVPILRRALDIAPKAHRCPVTVDPVEQALQQLQLHALMRRRVP